MNSDVIYSSVMFLFRVLDPIFHTKKSLEINQLDLDLKKI